MVTVGNQGRDDRYIRLWQGNTSLHAVSRSCDCHVFDKAFRSIMEGTIGSTLLCEQFVR